MTGAKVVASAKTPDSKCFGIVTMATDDDVERCIKELDGSSLHGKTIIVELVREVPPHLVIRNLHSVSLRQTSEAFCRHKKLS